MAAAVAARSSGIAWSCSIVMRRRPATCSRSALATARSPNRPSQAGWNYTAVEASPILIDVLRKKGLKVLEAWTPPMPMADASADVVYADQVLEHMSGIDAARQFTAEALRSLRPGGIFFVVVPDYLKERTFFWDVDYTHNFVTTERRVKQLFNDSGFEHPAHRAQHRRRHRHRARRARRRGAADQHPGRRRAVAAHRHGRSSSSRSARTCSRRSPSSRRNPKPT